MKEICLAGGCFWGVEEYFSRLPGVTKTKVGYANGHTENPSYEAVCSGQTGHVEAVYIHFDEVTLSLEKLLDKYLGKASSILSLAAFSFSGLSPK